MLAFFIPMKDTASLSCFFINRIFIVGIKAGEWTKPLVLSFNGRENGRWLLASPLGMGKEREGVRKSSITRKNIDRMAALCYNYGNNSLKNASACIIRTTLKFI